MKTKLSLLQAVNVAASKEETRYYLGGVFLRSEGKKLCMVATDGHRLFRTYVEGEGEITPFILSSPDIARLALIRKQLEIKLGKGIRHLADLINIEFNGEGKASIEFYECDTSLLVTPIDGTFPDYERVLPKRGKKTRTIMSVNAKYLADFTKAAKLADMNKGSLAIQLFTNDTNSDPIFFEMNYSDMKIDGAIMPMRA